jgi:hypothetical protein
LTLNLVVAPDANRCFTVFQESCFLARARAGEPQDVRRIVESALLNFVAAKEGDYYDEWDLFLAWPIADPKLEQLRQRCLQAIGSNFENHSDEAQRQVARILEELRESA